MENPEELGVLQNIERLLKFIVKQQLAQIFKEQLVDPKHLEIYQMTGNNPIREISEKTGISSGSISGLWQKWEELGIIEKDGKTYRKIP